jgi:DnaJ-class molecular chaperone
VPGVRGRPVVEHPCRTATGGRIVEERTLDVEIPPGIHDGQQIRLSGEGHAARSAGARGDRLRPVRVRPIRASCARATTSSRRST